MLGQRPQSSEGPWELSVFEEQQGFHARPIVDVGSHYQLLKSYQQGMKDHYHVGTCRQEHKVCIVYWIRLRIGSQCNWSHRSSVMGSNFSILKTTEHWLVYKFIEMHRLYQCAITPHVTYCASARQRMYLRGNGFLHSHYFWWRLSLLHLIVTSIFLRADSLDSVHVQALVHHYAERSEGHCHPDRWIDIHGSSIQYRHHYHSKYSKIHRSKECCSGSSSILECQWQGM